MSTPFVARETQVRQLLDALDRARAGAPTCVVVGGDAGVGKTRLLHRAGTAAAAAGALVVTGHCVDLGEIGLPYLPFAEALGALRTHVPGTVSDVVAARPALARLVDGAPAGGGDAGADRLQLFEGVAEVLAAAGTAEHPLVVVLEDLHWADASSRDLLRFLVSRLGAQHLLLVVSYRADDVHRRHPWRGVLAELSRHPRVERLTLEAFTDDELRAFTTAALGRPLPEGTLRRVRDRAEGNAYFTEELLEAGAESGDLPWSLADVLRARVEQLDPAALRLVQLASAAGRRVDEPLLRAAAQADAGGTLAAPGAVDAALREAVAHHVLVGEDGRIAFRHALLAEAVHADLLPGEAAAAHRAYLDATRTGPDLASHAERAAHALAVPDVAVALAESWAAAQDARRLLAPTEELRHLEVVLRLWDAVPGGAPLGAPPVGAHAGPDEATDVDEDDRTAAPDRAEVLRQASWAASRAGSPERAVPLARAALDETGLTPRRRAALHTVVARHLLAVDRGREAMAEASAALAQIDHLAGGPTRERAWALATYARAAVNAGRDEEAEQTAEQAAQVARAVADAGAESDAMTTLAVLDRLDHAQSAGLLEQALARAVESQDVATELRTRYNLTSAHWSAGDLVSAGRHAADGVRAARRVGMAWAPHGVDLHMFGALVAYATGDLAPVPHPPTDREAPAGAQALLQAVDLYAATARGDADVLDRARALRPWWTRDPLVTLIAGTNEADALTWAGQGRAAEQVAAEVLDRVTAWWSDRLLGAIRIGALALAGLAEETTAPGPAPADRDDLLARADAWLWRAERAAGEGRPHGGVLGPEGRAWLLRARAEHARAHGDADPDAWGLAVEAFGYGHRYEAARSRARLAEALLVVGDRAGAAHEAGAALAEAVALGAEPLAEQVRALVRRGRLAVDDVRLPGTDVLTVREAEVLALVAQGLSNRQVGERLFISGKTVSVHVSNVLAKLGASGRTEAVSIAHRRGLLAVGREPAVPVPTTRPSV
ncbi:helix-turn-helix transcriptional regulator [Cellulomonas oligotrophica]|uniref:DNA-binding CsgD family transcriptional regulator n=1 Tax=Cellulomonas oligotrophica TaxID=931536 RepID=A0A7Y9FH14_9CELL|nr:LuxR family transcriptional regulator [Cellulomonas oligotrophica]NYD87089.1 DNA-binding CsgD family transcriptional regulator [Cellulomonas oligotrophica]GIG32125.1 LuxR family transcriptional regulator [Cellulomonas oligotrophica]